MRCRSPHKFESGEEDPVDHHRGRDRGLQGQEPALTSSAPRSTPTSMAQAGDELPRRACQGKARHRAQGRQGGDHPRGRPLRHRRRRGRRAFMQGERASRSCVKEGYSATTPDLSSLVTKLKRARADVILHAGYNPDITLFLRQAREAGLQFQDADRQRRRLQPARQAARNLRRRHRLFLQHRSGAGAAARSPRSSRPGSAISSRSWSSATRARPAHRRAAARARWASTRPGFCSRTCCRSPRTKYGGFDPGGDPQGGARRRHSRPAAPSRAMASNSARPAPSSRARTSARPPVVHAKQPASTSAVVWPTNIKTAGAGAAAAEILALRGLMRVRRLLER